MTNALAEGDLEAVRTDPARLAAVRATGLLDSEIEEVFDRLTRIAVRLLHVPAAFISLVDSDRDFYKSACGFGEPLASARELGGLTFCHYTVQRSTPLVIPDTAADLVYRQVPTVKSLGVAAYVGVPLVVDGQAVGAFCAIDVKPHPWSADEVEVLVELAASAQREIELRGAISTLRLQRGELARAHDELRRQHHELETHAEELRTTAEHLEQRTGEAESANKSKEKFLSMMSHELRTPLTSIIGYADLLGMGVRGPVAPGQQEFLDRIERAGRHLQTLIGDILEFSRIDSGHVSYEIRDVDVDSAISEAAELVEPQISERGIEFTHERDASEQEESRASVRADENRLRQILVNLLTNAMKFTPIGGRVDVTWQKQGRRVRIAISDTGRGIPADRLDSIFEPFVQVDRVETEEEHQGVGLGLAICRQLARGMNGEIGVESRVGEGSTFTLVLPTWEGPEGR